MQENSYLNNNIDIICFSLSRWDSPISSPAVALAKTFSKTNRVFFIEHPYSWKDLITKKKILNKRPYRDGNVVVITPPVVLPINFIREGALYNRLSNYNNAILLRTLRTIIHEMNIDRYLFINFFDPYFLRSIPEDIKPVKFVYQCMDDMSQVAYTRKHGVRLEEEIIRHADITLCTSMELTKLKSAFSPNVYFHPNAADVNLFKTAFGNELPRPADVPTGKKIIGFTGSIEYRTDFSLLKNVAYYHSDKLIYLVGPVYEEEHKQAGLDQMENVIFAGPRKIEELPAYLQCFDCCIIPYKKNILTKSIYPLKINEYLAAGKPVVTTDFSDDIISFSDVAYVSNDRESFITLIDRAIQEDNVHKKHQRLARARLNSWENRVAEFWKLVKVQPIE